MRRREQTREASDWRKKPELTCFLSSRLSALDSVCSLIRAVVAISGLQPSFLIEVIARECLNNAIVHGNCNHSDRSIRLDVRLGRNWVRLRITDEGDGFDWRSMDFSELPGSRDTSGRGLPMIAAYARKIAFNRRGNQIAVWIKTSKQGALTDVELSYRKE